MHADMQDVEKSLGADEQSVGDVLRAAARLQQKNIYVFNLNSEPAACDVYPLLPQDCFRVLVPQQSKRKAVEVKDSPAWSATLGKDALPLQLLSPTSYLKHNMIVLSRQHNSFFAYWRRRIFTDSTQQQGNQPL